MDGRDRERLVELMTRMGGDAAAAVSLYQELGGPVRAAVRRVARRLHAEHLDEDDIDGLALDVCLALVPVARSWDPGGALPWVWAERRVVQLVSAYVGQYGDEYDDARHGHHGDGRDGGWADIVSADDDAGEHVTLARLADAVPVCGVLLAALESVTTARNIGVTLLYAVQQTQGDPSPSTTVARAYRLQPDNVRQIVHRTRAGLAALAAADDRFEELRRLPFVGLAETERSAPSPGAVAVAA